MPYSNIRLIFSIIFRGHSRVNTEPKGALDSCCLRICFYADFSFYISCFIHREIDDDEDEGGQNAMRESKAPAVDPSPRPYRLWYTVEVQASASLPERTLEVTCAAHSAVAVDIAVTNPTREKIVMDVLIEGVALTGEPTVILHPRQQVIYQVAFAPTVIGEYTGR